MKLSTMFSYFPVRYVFGVILLALALIPIVTTDAASPSDPRFNVYPDTSIGDERDFLRAKTSAQSTYTDPLSTTCNAGDELNLRITIHNGASEIFNGANNDGPGVAKDTTVKLDLPTGPATSFTPKATISASNAVPQSTTDQVAINCGNEVELEYVSTRYENASLGNIAVPGSDILSSNGLTVGWDKLDGDFPGCWEFRATVYVTVKVKETPKNPNVEINKEVREDDGNWHKSVNAEANDDFEYRITVKNTGDVDLENVVVTDKASSIINPDNGTVSVSGASTSSTDLFGSGVVIKKLAVGQEAIITFTATVHQEELVCGTNKLNNYGIVTAGEINKKSDAKVHIDKQCEESESFAKCSALTLDFSQATRKGTATATVEKTEDVTVTSYVFDWGVDGVENTTSETASASYTYAKAGTYKVVATVNFTVDGEEQSVDCESSITFADEPTVIKPPVKTIAVTGPAQILAGIFGTGTLAGASQMWLNSRRALKNSFLKG